MPIKFSKGFPRRKSSGNVLDEAPSGPKHSSNESTSSFRVLPRPNSTGKSLDSGSASRSMTEKPLPPARSSFEEDSEDLFAAVRTDVINRYALLNQILYRELCLIVTVVAAPLQTRYQPSLTIVQPPPHDIVILPRTHPRSTLALAETSKQSASGPTMRIPMQEGAS